MEPRNQQAALAAAACLLIFLNYFSRTSTLEGVVAKDAFLYLFAPPLLLAALGLHWREYGLQLGDLRIGLRYSAVLILLAIPFMLIGAQLPSFQHYYPWWPPAAENPATFVYFEALVGVRMLATEAVYRGILLFSLARLMPNRHANVIHATVYMLAHIGKPVLEVPYSFAAGLVFGHVDLKTKSILPSFLMHYASSILFDALVILL